MDKLIQNILLEIESIGYDAYVVGGYVRDYLLGIKSSDIDICTNALPIKLHELFPDNVNSNSYGGFNLKIKNYNIDITTFRKELKYDKRKPTEIVYVSKLEEDIIRRDFTINSVCMDSSGKIIDLVNGVKDITERKIRMLGDIKERLEEDPLRILRAVRFASILDFEIDSNLYKELKENYKLVETLSKTRIKSELDKILLNKNFLKGLSILKDLKILELFGITYEDISYVSDLSGMWAQLNFSSDFAFTKQENVNIIKIREIIEHGEINNEVLFNYGLYNSLVASSILNIDRGKVNKMYNELPIKSIKELDISSKELIDEFNIEPKNISRLKNDLIKNILNNDLKNENNEIKKYIKEWS